MYQPRARVVLLALYIGACGPTSKHHGDAGVVDATDAAVDVAPLPHTLTGLEVTPTNPLIELDLNADGSQGFAVTGHFQDGVDEDVTSQVTWTVMNPNVGAMSGSTLLIPAFTTTAAETSLITATLDGVTGQAQITVVAYRKSGAQQDFFFILPYQDPAGLQNRPLDFSTTIPALDVFFLMDTTGSMGPEIASLQQALTGTVIPGIQNAVANTQFGVGALEDFPLNPYGEASCYTGSPDQPFKLRQAITNNVSAVQSAVNGLTINGSPIGCGNDLAEGGLEAIYQAATGEGLTGPSPTSVPANHTGVGGVAFRQGTMPVIVDITDAMSHGDGETATCTYAGTTYTTGYAAPVTTYAHSRSETKTALSQICARLVGISATPANFPTTCNGSEYMRDLATSTGARVPPAAWDVGMRPSGCAPTQCCTGQNGAGVMADGDGLCPVVFDVSSSGTGVSTNIVTGIQMLARFATFDVPTDKQGLTTDTAGNPLPAGTTTADFIKAVTPTSFVLPPPPPVLPNPTFDTTTFHNVTPGTQVSFSVNAYNDFVQQTSEAQIFRATIRVLAGGCTPLDQRDVLILVPPTPIVIE